MFGEFIIKFRWGLLVLLLSILTGALFLLPNIEIDQNFDNYFPDEDPDLEFYRHMTAELGDEDDLLVVAVHQKNGIFDSVFLAKFQDFTIVASNIPHVIKARSLTNLNDVIRTPFGNLLIPFLHRSEPTLYQSDSLKLSNDERLLTRLISTDFKTLTVILTLETEMDGTKAERLISSLEKLGLEYEFNEMHIMGRRYFEVSHNRISKKELKKGFVLAIVLIIVLLGFIYRSFWGVLLPVLVYVFSMLIFLGYMVLRGHPLDILSNLAPTILLIVSVSDVIHFLSKYEDQLNAGLGKKAALKDTLNSIGLAIFLTSCTTAIGFLTLLSSDLPTLRKFGGDIAMGVTLAFLITVILVSFVLYCIPENAIHIRTDWYKWWDRMADHIFRIVRNDSKWIIGSAVFLTLVSIMGIPRINTNNFFVSSLPENHVSAQAAKFYEKNLGGIRTFEIALIPPKDSLLNNLVLLKEIEKLHRHIDSLPRTGSVYSPVTFYKSLNKSWYSGRNNAYTLPDSQKALYLQEQKFRKLFETSFRGIMNEEKSFGKLSVRMNDLGRKNVYALNKKVENWITANMDTSLLETRIIGASAMADKIQEHSIKNMFAGLLLALVSIGLLIFLFYRNWRSVVIVMTINVLPLIMTGALMAFLQIELVCVTSVIFTIGFVIAVDDTIHFIGRYHRERSRGLSNVDSISFSLRKTGRAMLLTTVVLFFGFAQLATSSFRDAQAVGILVSVMLVFALLVDLFLGPLMILHLLKPRNRS